MPPRPNFYLERPKPGKPTAISLHFNWSGAQLRMSTKEYVLPEHWDKKTHRIKEKFTDINPDYIEVNRVLDELAMFVTNTYNKFRRERKLVELTPEVLKRYLVAYRQGRTDGQPAEPVLDYYRRYMEDRLRSSLKASTTDSEMVSLNLFERFAATLPGELHFEQVTLRLFERYRDWFWNNTDTGDSTIHKHLKRFRQMCSHAAASGQDMGCDVNAIKLASQLRLSPAAKETIALYTEELQALHQLDLSSKPHLEKVRDLFVFFCHIGLRFNRWKEVGPDNFTVKDGTYYLDIYTQKGKAKRVIIPLDPMAVEIGKKYGFKPPNITGQVFNRQIKEVCLLAGFTEEIRQVKQIKGRSEILSTPKYQLVSTHTARRSFATSAYEAGLPVRDIMALTGHSQEKTLMRYIREDPRRNAERIAKHNRFNK
ncbi:site-specific integrase [Lewinella sp. W8]|uniref:site-specific integrase n=1 Tax=Lewinella sp. W8 TaxID=2528208 RepID=UPI0010676F0D|nr:site-specific integrase [Lewinella sp. W8]MTB50059.1 tyrosine-type recombinase/integrase [Lewinella sp. W8]